MKSTVLLLALALFVMLPIQSEAQTQPDAKTLLAEMMQNIGGKQAYYNLGGVHYDFEYRDPNTPADLVSKETYLFDGERSHGAFTEHSIMGATGKVVEGFNGKDAWVTIDGKASKDKKQNGVARFLRKTNYYWFNMLFKLLDEGTNHEMMGSKTVNGKDYYLIKMTFNDQVGDAQDTYVLYLNKQTKMIDQFLFTVVAMGVSDPLLMKMEYQTISGIKIPAKRRYVKSNWDGDEVGEKWTVIDWTNIRFDSKIDRTLFEL